MCDQCTQPDQPESAPPRRRARLWEIDSQWHCTIIGTCLTMGELRAAASRLGVQTRSAKPSDYEMHTAMILMISRERVVAKALGKLLDRKHAAMLTRFGKVAGEDALTALWNDMLGKGEVASACWAVMSHPDVTESLRNRVFGEIHMLSHQVGAASRADLRRVHALEREKADLEGRQGRLQERLKTEVGARNSMIRDLRRRLDCEIAENRRLGHAAHSADEMARLRRLIEEIGKTLDGERTARRDAEAETRRTLGKLRDVGLHVERLLQENDALRLDAAAADSRLALLLGQRDEIGDCSPECAELDLCGRCILFVGGRNQHVPHFRRLVEDSNGVFAHHDGGFEESMGKLHGLFGRADAVLFPVDCVSHSAHDEVKRLCRRWEKPFVPLRHSGLGAFIRALSSIAGAGVVADTAE